MIAPGSPVTDLTKLRRWVAWRADMRRGKPTKIPYQPGSHKFAATDNPMTWGSYDAACAMQGCDGSGLVLTGLQEIAALDLDDCRDPQSGRLEPWAHDLCERAQSYTEITPSDMGVRILGLVTGIEPSIRTLKRDKGKVEVFAGGATKYVTVTWERLEGFGDGDRLNDITPLVQELLAEADVKRPEAVPAPIAAGVNGAVIASILLAIPNDYERDEWVRLALAFKAAGGAFATFNAWSQTHESYDPSETVRVWESLKPSGKIGVGSIIHEARQRGIVVPAIQPEPEPEPEPPNEALGVWDAGEDTEMPPPREWLLGNIFCRGFASALLGDGGVGKTAVRYAQYLSLSVGRPLTGEHVFQRSRVLVVSLEDGKKELQRRILALLLHYGIDRSELKGWLFLAAPGRAAGKLMTTGAKGGLELGQLAANLEAAIVKHGIDLLALDPFIKTHSVQENDNNGIDAVVQVLTDLAEKYNIAVDTPHHMAKGSPDPGNANKGRGASAMKDAGRLIYTLTPMSTDEAQTFGIPEEERRSLVRMDSAKVNIAPMAKAKWFRLVGVPLGNATDLYPNGDHVQTVEPWTPPDTWADLGCPLLNRILDDIDAGLPDGNRYSDAPNAGERAAWKIVTNHAPTKTEGQAREVIRAWVKHGVLIVEEYDNPTTRKRVQGMRLDPTKRPGGAVG